jgi:hypothetical protein
MLGLRTLGTSEAIAALRQVLAGQVKTRTLAPDEEAEPGGMVSFTPAEGALCISCSDAANAARLLAQLEDIQSAGTIRMLAAAAKGEDRKLFEEALSALSGKGPESPAR